MEVFRPELHAWPLRAYVDATRDAIGPEKLEALLGKYGTNYEELQDPNAWISVEFVEAFIHDTVMSYGEDDYVERATRLGMTRKYLGVLFPLIFVFGTPISTFQQIAKAAARFNKTGVWTFSSEAPGTARMTFRRFPHISPERMPYVCRVREVQMALIPEMCGRTQCTVSHPRCMLRGDDACEYAVSWREPPRQRDATIGGLVGLGLGGVLALIHGLSAAPAATLVFVGAIAGWALGRLLIALGEVRERVAEITDHNQALAKMTRANEERFQEVVAAKAEVEKKVEQRTLELREATQRLSVTLAEIQDLDRAKTDFFNNVSHELRSPLTMILAPLEDLAAGRSPPGGERATFESMRRNASRLLQLINQLLDLAKIDAGKMEIAPAPADLPGLANSVVTGFEAAAEKKGVKLQLQAPTTMAPVLIDSSWIESAITNLVANALRFTHAPGAVRVIVAEQRGEVSITVSDDGEGIAPADQPRVFARFAQGDAGGRKVGGTGIGLALVREAARLHGGDVRLVSELGKGASFTMTLPRRPDDRRGDESGSAGRSVRPDTTAQRARQLALDEFKEQEVSADREGPSPVAPLALVVEDNPELRSFIADVLATNYRVRTATDGRHGVQLALELKPQVVISDVAMPEMNGYELCRALREEDTTRTIPILLVTARTDVASVLEGFEVGANDYVLKPFHGRELLARVDVHVRLRRMVQELALRERHATLGVLAASVAHQVRNPLTTLISGLPAMQGRMKDKVDQRTADLLEVMIDCATRIERVTLDLMDLSRIDREEGGDYRPSDGLRSAVRMLYARAGGNVQVEDKIDDAPVINGRVGDMNHVFLNLLDNAIRAVGEGGQVRVEAWNANGAYFVRVGDSGPGISAEVAARIFEPFFTTRAAGEGTGLGLAIARQVVQQAGGDITVDRSDLGGASLLVRIPTARKYSRTPPRLDTHSS